MIPIYLAPGQARIAVIGRSQVAARRVAWLNAGGAKPDVWSDRPAPEVLGVSENIRRRLPSKEEISHYHAIWIADFPKDQAEDLARDARAAGVLVNVEDVPSLCDFHSPAVVRRGKLTLTAATGGASPTVARMARERIEAAFDETWGEALDEIAKSRAALRERGASFDALIADARARLIQHGLV